MKKHNTFEIGAPCSPSYLISSKTEKCLKISVTAGGGMGGSFWDEFGTTKDVIENGGFIKLKDVVTKKEKILNTNFIVKAEEVMIVKCVWDTTNWANYNKTTCKKQTRTLYYYFPSDAKISISSSYIGNDSISKHIVKNIIEEE